jgi:carboxylate-amine ligase
MIDFGKKEEVDTVELIKELLEFVDDTIDELGSRKEINYIYEIFKTGTGARRQLKVYNDTNDIKEVVKYIVEQTNAGLKE